MLRIKACGLSDVGLTRVHNEDYFEIDARHRLYVVADGMGGHSAGEVAAQIAVKAIHDFIEKSVGRDATRAVRVSRTQPSPRNPLPGGGGGAPGRSRPSVAAAPAAVAAATA